MKRPPLSITVVSFSSRTQSQDVQDALCPLGYKIDAIDGQKWLSCNAQCHNGLAALSLGTLGSERPPLESLLRKVNSVTCLGILHRDHSSWDSRLFKQCVDFVVWPCTEAELPLRLERLYATLVQPSDRTHEQGPSGDFVNLHLIGQSHTFLRFLNATRRIASWDAPVLIQGETGSGKELAARAIHYLGTRRDYPFIAVNCGAIPDNLTENEFFGHERGAYTDAREAQPGLVAQADNGTLFLDEVESLSPKAQVALLRFLQDQEFKPLGGTQIEKVDVRLIAASNANLQRLVDENQFREDLMFRLNILDLVVPPLRERYGDVSMLAEHFLRKCCAKYKKPSKRIHPETSAWMEAYHWPGNVRELENLVHRGFLMSGDETIGKFLILTDSVVSVIGA